MSDPAFVQLFKHVPEPYPNGECGRCGRWIVYDTDGSCSCVPERLGYDSDDVDSLTTSEVDFTIK